MIEAPSPDSRIRSHLRNRVEDVLSQDDFRHLYNNACGTLMHASNPFRKTIDYGDFNARIPTWHTKISNLLNCHIIKLVNDENMYLVHMKEERDNKVHVYTFAPIKEPLQAS